MPETTTEATPTQRQLRAQWDAIAAAYDTCVTDTEVWLANEALARAGLKPNDRFLDVAAGCGGLSLPAARRGANVVATDWSGAMIERMMVRARREGLSNIEGRIMECHQLDLDDNSFDIAGSQFGVMLVPDQAAAFREMARVTRPGGRVLVIAYGSPADVEFLQFFIAALQAVVRDFTGPPMDPPPLEFQLSDPIVFRERLTAAGLDQVRVETVQETLPFQSGGELWDWILGGNPLPGMLAGSLTRDGRAEVCQVLDRMLRERSIERGAAVLTNPVHIGIGVKRA